MGQIFNKFKDSNEFRKKLVELVAENSIEIAYTDNKDFKKLKSCTSFMGDPAKKRYYPIQDDTTVLVTDKGRLYLFINVDTISKSKMKYCEIENTNKKTKQIKNTLSEIEEVLGPVPIVEKLRKQIREWLKSVNEIIK